MCVWCLFSHFHFFCMRKLTRITILRGITLQNNPLEVQKKAARVKCIHVALQFAKWRTSSGPSWLRLTGNLPIWGWVRKQTNRGSSRKPSQHPKSQATLCSSCLFLSLFSYFLLLFLFFLLFTSIFYPQKRQKYTKSQVYPKSTLVNTTKKEKSVYFIEIFKLCVLICLKYKKRDDLRPRHIGKRNIKWQIKNTQTE